MRIGLIGTESDHAVDFLRMLNAMERNPGDRIIAVWGEEEARTEDVAQRFGPVSVKQRTEDVAAEVDAALLVSRYGSLHLGHALPFITRGLPVFIDKPLACSLRDATAILDAAKRSGAPVMSASALRWQPDTDAVTSKMAALGRLISVTATGTFYPDSPYGGSYFYGIHAAELAVQLAGGDIEDVAVDRAGPGGVVVHCRVASVDVTVRLVPPARSDDIIFHVEAVCEGGIVESTIGLGDGYMAPVLNRFLAMAHHGKVPLTNAEMLAPIKILDAAENALRTAP